MKVRMKIELTGYAMWPDGRYIFWPKPGTEVEVPDSMGAALCASGHAEPIGKLPQVERAVAPEPEKRTAKKTTRRPLMKKDMEGDDVL